MNTPDPSNHIWWLASRASGFVALILITASVLLGLAMATKLLRRPGMPRILNALHEQLAIAGLVAIGLHAVTLLGDPWLNPGVDGITVPGAIGYRTLWVALGIGGGYLAAILGLSFYARKRIGTKRWRNAHRFVIVAWFMSVAHTLGAGTDAAVPWVRYAVLAPLVPAIVLLALRMLGRPDQIPAEEQPARPHPKAAVGRQGSSAAFETG